MKPEENPWGAVNTLEDFQFYCCPECDLKEQTKDKFVKHALENHTECKEYIVNLMIKPELYEEEDYSIIEKIDCTSHYDFTEKSATKSEIKQDFINNAEAPDDDKLLLDNCDDNFEESRFSSDLLHVEKKPKKLMKTKHSTNDLNGNNNMEENTITKFKMSRRKLNSCQECGKTYPGKYLLTRHIDVVHKGLKPFKCEHCGKNYTASHILSNHIKSIHEGRRDFKCELCQKSFSLQSNMITHIQMVHHKTLDQQCHTCGKSFSNMSSLRRHQKVSHEGAKNTCPVCGKLLSASRSMKEHISSVHEGITNFSCEECGKRFARLSTLKRHKLNVHNLDIKPIKTILKEDENFSENKYHKNVEIAS